MSKQKTLEQLRAEKERAETQLAHEQRKLHRLENRMKYLEKGERQKRTHRLITRGAAVESIAPLAKVLTEVEFYTFAEKVLALPEVKGLLMEVVNAHNEAEQKGGVLTIALFHFHVTQVKRSCRTVRHRFRCLPCRGKAVQRVLRRSQRLHPQRRCDLLRYSPAVPCPAGIRRPSDLMERRRKSGAWQESPARIQL